LLHHVSIRTANIHRAIAFYECLGFELSQRFTTGYTLACWLTGHQSRLELIQIPEPHPAPDAFHDQHYVGYYHISLAMEPHQGDLDQWLQQLSSQLQEHPDFKLELKILLAPHQQTIGPQLYEVAFLADPDGLPIELLREYP
jgi:catechol 2,3-dioxygenase-like lactoylglutathione lyase family enzyme